MEIPFMATQIVLCEDSLRLRGLRVEGPKIVGFMPTEIRPTLPARGDSLRSYLVALGVLPGPRQIVHEHLQALFGDWVVGRNVLICANYHVVNRGAELHCVLTIQVNDLALPNSVQIKIEGYRKA